MGKFGLETWETASPLWQRYGNDSSHNPQNIISKLSRALTKSSTISLSLVGHTYLKQTQGEGPPTGAHTSTAGAFPVGGSWPKTPDEQERVKSKLPLPCLRELNIGSSLTHVAVACSHAALVTNESGRSLCCEAQYSMGHARRGGFTARWI